LLARTSLGSTGTSCCEWSDHSDLKPKATLLVPRDRSVAPDSAGRRDLGAGAESEDPEGG
jgi:hypothetical protein